jgi:hypothetical protein
MIEVGTEPVENIHSHYEKQLDTDLKKSWDDIDTGAIAELI